MNEKLVDWFFRTAWEYLTAILYAAVFDIMMGPESNIKFHLVVSIIFIQIKVIKYCLRSMSNYG